MLKFTNKKSLEKFWDILMFPLYKNEIIYDREGVEYQYKNCLEKINNNYPVFVYYRTINKNTVIVEFFTIDNFKSGEQFVTLQTKMFNYGNKKYYTNS